MRYLILFFCLTIFGKASFSQKVIYSDDFEEHTLSADLVSLGYDFKQNSSYTNEIIATVEGDNTNQYASCAASVNGQASMQLRKKLDVVPGRIYKFTLLSKSPFKRHLRIYESDGTTLIKKNDDFTPTETEKNQWIAHEISFIAEADVTTVYFGIFHNWSGTLLLDDFKVEEEEIQELPDYYLSSTDGDDTNAGTIDAPWKTLERISMVALKPGNTVNFKCGDRFNGHFVINGSGTKEQPITITSYGTGNKPIITGEVGSESGGDYQEAILVENQSHFIFDGLEINNERLVDREGVDPTDAFGIYILNSGKEVMRNFVFRNMTFQNVYASKPILQGEGEDSFNGLEVSAVMFFTEKNTVAGEEKHIRDILVEDCYFSNLQRLGVKIKHAGGATDIGNDTINRNMNMIFRNNEFHHLGGTCILPTRTYNCLIEDNLFNHPGSDMDPRMPNRGSSVWTWNCYNTIIQRNFCLSVRGYLDSHGIHIDHKNVNTFVQYNYMEDCEGGFVEILGGNLNAVYRFNISVNDGWRDNPNWVNSNHTLWINEKAGENTVYCDSSYIYNNTVLIDSPYSTAIDINAKNTFIYNNIFMALNGAQIGGKQVLLENNGTTLLISNNLYQGDIATSFMDNDGSAVSGDPIFESEKILEHEKFQLKENSPAINAGLAKRGPVFPLAGQGIFKDIPFYAEHDFYGNPVDLSKEVNIGACNASFLTSLAFSKQEHNIFKIYPNPIKDTLNLEFEKISGNLNLFIYDLKGTVVYKSLVVPWKKDLEIELPAELKNGLYFLKLFNNEHAQTKQFVLYK